MSKVVYLPKRPEPTKSEVNVIRFAEASQHHERARLMIAVAEARLQLAAMAHLLSEARRD